MPVNIPQSVFDKYFDVIDSTFDIFGVTCQLVSIEKRQIVNRNINNNYPSIDTVNPHIRGVGNVNSGNSTIIETEVLTDIKLKVYWDSKQWIKISDNIVAPNTSIQTICFMSDLDKVLNAKALIVHKDIKDKKEMRFERIGEHIPLGLKQTRYFGCFWKRI
jgi:hypothetical protein